MAFQSYFDSLPFSGSFDNGMPKFPLGGAYYGYQAPLPQPVQGSIAPSQPINYGNGSGVTVSGFQGDGLTVPSTHNYGDASNYAFDFGGFGAAPSPSLYNGVQPAQTVTSLGSLGLGDIGQKLSDRFDSIGQKISDRFDSLTQTPHFDINNAVQAGINAAGMFVPFVSPIAGILQGFNMLDPGETTGNSLADVAGTPGMVQQGFANLASGINQFFGGQPMPSSYITPNMAGPPTPNGDPYNGGPGGYIAPPVMGPDYAPPNPAGPVQDSVSPGWGGAGSLDYIPQADPFFMTGGQALDIGGAGVFNSIGLAPWQQADYGGAMNYASMGTGGFNPWGGNFSADNNGGWGQ